MRYALFLGCTTPARSRQYEMSSRAVLERLGVEVVDLSEFSCCGYPIKASDYYKALLISARNLAICKSKGLSTILTICSSCNSMLRECAYLISKDSELKEKIDKDLKKVGLSVEDDIEIKHIAKLLYEDVGLEEIGSKIERPLKGLKIANHYGCHYLMPKEIYEGEEDILNPYSLDRITEITGAQIVHYGYEKSCCGGPLLVSDEDTALEIARQKLDRVKEAGADAINLVCPFCSLMYDGNQKGIERRFETKYRIPVLYITQLLGLSMGIDSKSLGLNLNVVKARDLIDKIS